MNLRFLDATRRKADGYRSGQKQTAARRSAGACALVALALIGCGSEAAAPEATAGTAPATTNTAAPNMAGATAGSPAAATTPATTTKTDTATGSTTAPAANTGMTATPSGAMPATTPPTGAATTTPATTPAAGQPAMPSGMNGMPDMTGTPATGIELPVEMGTPTLFWLEITTNAAYTAGADGSGAKPFATGGLLSAPDGVAVDPAGGHVYILNMGTVLGGSNTGSLIRYKLDGSGGEAIMPPGSMADGQTFNTGKQVSMDKVNRKLYMGDREGSKVWRCDMDGKNLEVLVSGHGIDQVVGVAPDPLAKQFYFSDRMGRKLMRASMDMPAGKTHADRDDLEMLYFDAAPNSMPLDIELDVKERIVYWTDRQQNSVFSMPMDMPAGMDGMTRKDVKLVKDGLLDVIGLGFDHENKMLYATHSGTVSSFKADGSGAAMRIGSNGRTGLTFAKIP